MGRLENMKSEYDNIPIPKELNARIQKEIEKSAWLRRRRF